MNNKDNVLIDFYKEKSEITDNKEEEDKGIILKTYGDYLNMLGCTGDPVNEKVIAKGEA